MHKQPWPNEGRQLRLPRRKPHRRLVISAVAVVGVEQAGVEKNDIGIYVYTWEQKDYGHGAVVCRARLCRTPTRLHKLECIVLQHKNHFVCVKNYQALMSNRGIIGSKHAAILHCHRCGNHYYSKKLLDNHLKTCDPWP